MKRLRIMRHSPCATPARRGVSLSEVLVSMLVMSIGVVAVATIFPLSVLRTIQATQLTNAAQLRYNFEGLSGSRPELIAGAGVWEATTSYQIGDLVVGRDSGDRYYECVATPNSNTSGPVEPNWSAQPGQQTGDPPGSSPNLVWMTHRANVYVVDPLGWQERTQELRDLGLTPQLSQANVRNTFGRTSLGTNPTVLPMDSPFRIVRFRGGVARHPPTFPAINPQPSSSTFFPAVNSPQDIAARFGARDIATLADSWVLQNETTDLQSATPTSVQIRNNQSQLVATLDLDGDSQLDFRRGTGAEQELSARITFFNALGTRSVVRPITTVTSPSTGVEQINWVANLPALPAGDSWGRARVETWEQRYSWMLAVRKGAGSGTSYMNLVVFFRRSTNPEDELIHPAHFRASGSSLPNLWPGTNGVYEKVNVLNPVSSDDVADLNVNTLGVVTPVAAAGPDGLIGTEDDVTGKPLVLVRYHPAIGAGSPFLQRGGYICDSQNNRWYRIVSYDEVSDVQAVMQMLDGNFSSTNAPFGAFSGRGAIVRLETPVQGSSGFYTRTPQFEPPGGAILMRGIVDVYPL